jgi:hypothetical protein
VAIQSGRRKRLAIGKSSSRAESKTPTEAAGNSARCGCMIVAGHGALAGFPQVVLPSNN